MELPPGTDVTLKDKKSSGKHRLALINPLSPFISRAVIISNSRTPSLLSVYRFNFYNCSLHGSLLLGRGPGA